jgi:membrane-anchored protein YejM (alkaline phosphatase superfamily)
MADEREQAVTVDVDALIAEQPEQVAEVVAAVDYVKATREERAISPREAHAAFVYHLASRGWSHGAELDAANKQHPFLVHWPQLPAEARRAEAELFGFADEE